jgi:4-amino-4-deoxy-L-arabinose transferase-like glycosyltransferase
VLLGLAVGVLTALAAALRFWNAASWPPGLEYDEGLAGVDALNVLAGQFALYFREAYREPLYVYLIAPAVALVGREPLALRLPGMLLGVMLVPLTVLLARDLLASWGTRAALLTGLLAAGLAGVAFWPLVLSRSAVPAAPLPVVALLALWCCWRAWMAPPPAWGRFALAGMMVGLALYSYLPARLLPLVIGLFLTLNALLARRQSVLARHWRGVVLMVAVAGLVWLPLGLVYLQDPAAFLGRASHVSIFRPGVPERNAALAVLRSARQAFGAFLWQGDPNWYHNLPGRPIFDPPVAALAVLGAIVLLARARQPAGLLLLVWTGVMVLPGVLSDDNNPNTMRLAGLIPVAFFFPAVGFTRLVTWLERWQPRAWRLGGVLAGVLVFAVAGETAVTFAGWATRPEAFAARSGEAFDAAQAMNALGWEPGVCFLLPISNAWPPARRYQHRSIQFLYIAPAPAAFVRVDDEETPEQLDERFGGCRRIYTVIWKQGPHVDADPKALVPFLLTRAGNDVFGQERQGFELLGVDVPPGARFRPSPLLPLGVPLGGRLEAVAARLEPSWSGRELAVAVRWRLVSPSAADEKLSYRVLAADGELIGQVDRPLLANNHLGTSRWQPGEEATDWVIVPLLPGAPPGRYRLEVVAYQGGPPVAAELGEVVLPPARLPYQPEDLELTARTYYETPALRLVGFTLETVVVRPEEAVAVTLYWSVKADQPPAPLVTVALVSGGRSVASAAAPAGALDFPAERWTAGLLVADRRRLVVPAESPPGRYQVAVMVAGEVVVQGGSVTIQP